MKRETIRTVVPVSGEWECLIPYLEPASKLTLFAIDPVLAWGWTSWGRLRPITVGEFDDMSGGYALRRCGEERVYAGGAFGGYKSAEEWIVAEHLPPQLR